MTRSARLATALVASTTLMLLVAPLALAHAGEEHPNPLGTLLHQGVEAMLVAALVIGLVSVTFWWRGRRPGSAQHGADEQARKG